MNSSMAAKATAAGEDFYLIFPTNTTLYKYNELFAVHMTSKMKLADLDPFKAALVSGWATVAPSLYISKICNNKKCINIAWNKS